MGAPHKHAEIIKAWADGAEVQMKVLPGVWANVTFPDFSGSEYRIKPEPKPDVIQSYHITKSQGHYETAGPVCPPKEYRNPNIALTFDGETGKLKAAEVLK